ncbi:MAG: LptA/OstA family protein [Phenylobacterium sp.]|jgi:lipopolysaccharide export system protein LptA
MRDPKGVALAAATLALVAAAPLGAQAQLARNSKAPVDITADQLELVNSQCSAIYRGGAEALQETSRLRADQLKIVYAPAAEGAGRNGCSSDLLRMEATGSVFYVTPEQRVRGDQALYDAKAQTLTVTGSVVASRGQDVMKGGRLVVNTVSGDARMEGGTDRSSRRVRTVIYPGASPDSPR